MSTLISILLFTAVIYFYFRNVFLGEESIAGEIKGAFKNLKPEDRRREELDSESMYDVCPNMKIKFREEKYYIKDKMLIGRGDTYGNRLNLVNKAGDKFIHKNHCIISKIPIKGDFCITKYQSFLRKKNPVYLIRKDGSKIEIGHRQVVLKVGMKIMFVNKRYILEVVPYDATEIDTDMDEQATTVVMNHPYN